VFKGALFTGGNKLGSNKLGGNKLGGIWAILINSESNLSANL
jgi:hypothetical protein